MDPAAPARVRLAPRGPMVELFAATDSAAGFEQYLLIGLVMGSLYALIALGYTMVYGIIELINFAHGDLFMLGSFLALTLGVAIGAKEGGDTSTVAMAVVAMLVAAPLFCAGLNMTVDRLIYKPLRKAPK